MPRHTRLTLSHRARWAAAGLTNDLDHWHPALLRAAKAEGTEDPHGWLMNDLATEIRELVRDFVEKKL